MLRKLNDFESFQPINTTNATRASVKIVKILIHRAIVVVTLLIFLLLPTFFHKNLFLPYLPALRRNTLTTHHTKHTNKSVNSK